MAADLDRQLVAVDPGDAVRPPREQLGGEVAERADQARAGSARSGGRGAARTRGSRPAADRGCPGGRHLRTLATKTSSRVRPMPSSRVLSSLPGGADEGDALQVLVVAGRLADEHQVGGGIAAADDHLGAPLAERAPDAGDDLVAVVGLELPRPGRRGRTCRQASAAVGRTIRRLWRREHTELHSARRSRTARHPVLGVGAEAPDGGPLRGSRSRVRRRTEAVPYAVVPHRARPSPPRRGPHGRRAARGRRRAARRRPPDRGRADDGRLPRGPPRPDAPRRRATATPSW